MWFLSFIPDSWIQLAIHAVTITGTVLFALGGISSRLPLLGGRGRAIKWLGAVLLLIGVFFEGGIGNEMSWRLRVQQQEAEIARLKAASENASVKIVTKYIERTKVVKEKNDAIRTQVTKYITKEADANCSIPRSAIVLHDAAAKNVVPDSASGVNEGTAGDITLSKLLDTTVLNYGTFYEVREQLKALQDWVREQKKINP